MADKITTPIPDIGTSWENYGGDQVEAFLKDQLTGLTNAKIGDWHLVNGADVGKLVNNKIPFTYSVYCFVYA